MDHLAIMQNRSGFLEKIIAGSKTIESRWYKNKIKPWHAIARGDIIYFKNSSRPVTAKAKVTNVLYNDNLNPQVIKQLIQENFKQLGLDPEQIEPFYQIHKNKNYCILIYLDYVQEVKPFQINKKGFGSMSAWITVESINSIKI